MTRELRLKVAGILFYVVLILNLAFSESGSNFFCELFTKPEKSGLSQSIAAIIGAGAILFTSDAIGYLFTSIHVFFWNIIRGGFDKGLSGYSGEWERLSYDPKIYIIELYARKINSGQQELNTKFNTQLGSYKRDVFLSTIWQRAPEDVVNWSMRRYTAYFVGMATVCSLFSGVLISSVAIYKLNMNWTYMNNYILTLVSVLILIIYCNAQSARNEAWQLIDLWLAEKINPQFETIMKKVVKVEDN